MTRHRCLRAYMAGVLLPTWAQSYSVLLVPAGVYLAAVFDWHFYSWRRTLPLLPLGMATYFVA